MRVGEKGQVVIPKEIRERTGIREGTEVIVEASEGLVTVRRAGPPATSYVEYFTSTYAKKLKRDVDVKKILEESPQRDEGIRGL